MRAALIIVEPQGGRDLFPHMPTSSCHRRVLLLREEDHATGRFLKLPLAYSSGFGSGFKASRKMSLSSTRSSNF